MKNNKKINAKEIDEENEIKIVSTTTMTLAKRQHLKIVKIINSITSLIP